MVEEFKVYLIGLNDSGTVPTGFYVDITQRLNPEIHAETFKSPNAALKAIQRRDEIYEQIQNSFEEDTFQIGLIVSTKDVEKGIFSQDAEHAFSNEYNIRQVLYSKPQVENIIRMFTGTDGNKEFLKNEIYAITGLHKESRFVEGYVEQAKENGESVLSPVLSSSEPTHENTSYIIAEDPKSTEELQI